MGYLTCTCLACCPTGVLLCGCVVWLLAALGAHTSTTPSAQWMLPVPAAVQLVHQQLPHLSIKHLQNRFAGVHSKHKRAASSREVNFLVQQGVLKASSRNVMLVCISAAVVVMQQLHVHREVVAELHACTEVMPTSAAAQQPLAHARATTTVAAAATPPGGVGVDGTAPCIQHHMPVTLPHRPYTPEQLKQRYGLHALANLDNAHMQLLEAALSQLQQWCCTPVQLNRPSHMRAWTPATWEGNVKELHRYLGFICMHCGVEQPTLHHFLNGHLVMQCVDFLQQRGVQPQQLGDMVGLVSRVTTYLHATQQLSDSCQQLVAGYQHTLHTLQTQVSALQPHPRPALDELEAQGKWMEPQQLMVAVQTVYAAATRLVTSKKAPSASTALQVMHSAMSCFMFGYLPPLRPSVIASLQMPEYTGPCMWEGCQHPEKCKGNRLQWHGSSSHSSSTTTSSSSIRLVAPHHKSGKHVSSQPIDCVLPAELSTLMLFHLHKGRQLLVQSYVAEGLQEPTTVFITEQGTSCTAAEVSQVWRDTVLPPGYNFGPQTARGAFVTLARGDDCFVEPAGAAAVMGHSLNMWDTVYDKQARQKGVQAAVDGLADWRKKVVAQHKACSKQACSDESDGDDEWLPVGGRRKGMGALPARCTSRRKLDWQQPSITDSDSDAEVVDLMSESDAEL